MIVDTSFLLALFNEADPDHLRCTNALASNSEPLVVSPFVIAELDYVVSTRLGIDAGLAVLAELAGGSWDLPLLASADLQTAVTVVTRYRDRNIGVTDASLVVLADRYRTIATLDHRHFGVLRPLDGGRFRIVP